jgi:hypothetical protein
LFTGFLYLFAVFSGSFAYRIGLGLQEYAAMFFLMITGFFIFKKENHTLYTALIAGGLGVVSYWLRQDHLFAILALGLLIIPTKGRAFIRTVWNNRCWIILYTVVIALGVLAVALRNYLVGGHFGLTTASNMGYLQANTISDSLRNLYVLLLGTGPNQLPFYFHSVVMIVGTGIGIIALFIRRGMFTTIERSYGIILIGIILPYLVINMVAYFPRFSIHLLPFTVLLFSFAVYYVYHTLLKQNTSFT